MATATATAHSGTEQQITLKGSTELVTEFFQIKKSDTVGKLWWWDRVRGAAPLDYSVNRFGMAMVADCKKLGSILYMRGVYPPDDFKIASKYGLKLLVSKDEGLNEYLDNVMRQLKDWILNKAVQKLVIVISSIEGREVLERWQFDLQIEGALNDEGIIAIGWSRGNSVLMSSMVKPEKDIHNEIAAIIRQITASVTFLPLLDQPCSFDLLIYTNKDLAVPSAWEESDPRYVKDAEEVRMRSFTTSIHRVGTAVTYRSNRDA